jgi:hypothetical protein
VLADLQLLGGVGADEIEVRVVFEGKFHGGILPNIMLRARTRSGPL